MCRSARRTICAPRCWCSWSRLRTARVSVSVKTRTGGRLASVPTRCSVDELRSPTTTLRRWSSLTRTSWTTRYRTECTAGQGEPKNYSSTKITISQKCANILVLNIARLFRRQLCKSVLLCAAFTWHTQNWRKQTARAHFLGLPCSSLSTPKTCVYTGWCIKRGTYVLFM